MLSDYKLFVKSFPVERYAKCLLMNCSHMAVKSLVHVIVIVSAVN